MGDQNKAYALGEFKRRHRLQQLRQNLQKSMQDKYQELWWCKDEALTEMRLQFIESSNHCVMDSFLGAQAFKLVLEEVNKANERGMMDKEGILTFQGRETSIRTDHLGWFDCTSTPSKGVSCQFQSADPQSGDADASTVNPWPHLRHLLQRMETIVAELGGLDPSLVQAQLEKGSLGAHQLKTDTSIGCAFKSCQSRSKVMVTIYKGEEGDGSRYTKHLDNGNENGRRVTAIYYLNEDWKRAHGGTLRMYAPSKREEEGDGGQNKDQEEMKEVYTDCEPVADRLVLFLSDERTPHEVLPAHKNRLAVTVWFYDPGEKLACNERENAAAAAQTDNYVDGVGNVDGEKEGGNRGEEEDNEATVPEKQTGTVFGDVEHQHEHQQQVEKYFELD